MSKFLGPIHFWVYQKIQIQHDIIESIIKVAQPVIPNLKEQLDQKYGESETRPLEEVIDEGNIHGWLQERVSQEEYKLADSVTQFLSIEKDAEEKIKAIFFEKGRQIAQNAEITNASEAFQVLSNSLLDGMPCDRVNEVIDQDEDKAIWRRTHCIQKSYWDQVGGSIEVYDSLRDAFIEGVIENSPLVYTRQADSYEIRRKTNE